MTTTFVERRRWVNPVRRTRAPVNGLGVEPGNDLVIKRSHQSWRVTGFRNVEANPDVAPPNAERGASMFLRRIEVLVSSNEVIDRFDR